MDSEKLDPQLGLALNMTEEERARSLELNIGYDTVSKKWELLIQYTGNLQAVVDALSLPVVYLLGDYAIITIDETDIPRLLEFPEVAYVEKPRSLVLGSGELASPKALVAGKGEPAFPKEMLQSRGELSSSKAMAQSRGSELGAMAVLGMEMEGISASCLPGVYREPLLLTGTGIIICVVDSGIDYAHPAFLNLDGSTRILGIWDQTVPGNPPEGFFSGSFYSEEDINRALEASRLAGGGIAGRRRRQEIVSSEDFSGHGTHVAGIASNVALGASLLIVKLASGKNQDVPKTAELMQAVTFAKRFADSVGMPVAINISYGNNYGAHDGTALTERYLDAVAATARVAVCVGMGNDGGSARHVSRIFEARETWTEEFSVAPFETGLNLQIWKQLPDEMEIVLIAPGGERITLLEKGGGLKEGKQYQSYRIGSTEVSVYQGFPTPYNQSQQIFVSFTPIENYITSGIWQVFFTTGQIANGQVNLWLPVAEATSAATGFLRPTVETTLTIPSSAGRVISVAAYNSITNSQVAFSGRGFTRASAAKPDLAAPGVDINSAAPGGGYSLRTGTSMATPFVAGSAALLMQWGIVEGNDPYLYGEKLRSYLTRGARRLPGYGTWPNPQLGWGALCVRDSIPV